ncbi:hypothetical protein Z946_3314 [Sulfitobacter noctilucicola]|uniref:CENP-V/GFA domain-containing protein n=1 Tax=Sulfitobacter noctilucicola TaxID=1342301 RepID=A0A7W6M8G7_9RHOB|nr:DUF6151 family protein [Sulfitobacter noctilucicola]KIN64423.1 hypothetical protein Z946_3314 [Sulfitobacter noctilucicola]MBB4174418.1 hypothetical protein [Sulfitobacter noctilucicola]
MAGAAIEFSCACQKIRGELHNAPAKGLHLGCFCASCLAGALHAGDAPDKGEPVYFFLTQPENINVIQGLDQLKPYAFSPEGIIRWQAACCGGQIFSSQPDPKSGFMSVRTDKLSDHAALGPVRSRAFVPTGNGKTRIEGKARLAKYVFNAVRARLSGRWRKTPLYNVETEQPIVPVTLISVAEKRALLDTV